ncbi:TetR/AcrR family transcriptional regulator [Micromonospora sp. CPCC 205539]|uniref:TetR/AcrR family transcriptional regulator n=1 Tax=Micromonospora sp. CPCC 205539 TaxID=3122408 RepID=UPI002FF22FDD
MSRAVPDTHGEILAAAARRFAVAGYGGTSLQDIAREVGCSKATVLYHFANKEALLAELMAPAITVLQDLDDQLTGLTGTAAQKAAAAGFVDLAVRFRREIALLRGEFPVLLCQPAFAHIQQISERLRDAFAGHSDRPGARITALVLLAGISEACAEFVDIPDDELRPALLALVLRALEPVDAPLPQPPTTEDKEL